MGMHLVPVAPSFNLVLGRNRGVSFGLLSADHPAAPWLPSSLALAVVVGLVVEFVIFYHATVFVIFIVGSTFSGRLITTTALGMVCAA